MPDDNKADHIKSGPPSASDIRQLKRAQRKLLSEIVQKQHSQALCQNLTKQGIYKNSKNIACYLANDGEIDPYLIIEVNNLVNPDVLQPGQQLVIPAQ